MNCMVGEFLNKAIGKKKNSGQGEIIHRNDSTKRTEEISRRR